MQYRFRALVTLDPQGADASRRRYDVGTRHLLVYAWRLDESSHGKYLPALILSDGEQLEPGRSQIATIVVTDDEALAYLAPGQVFTLWGQAAGRGIISRRIFTDQSPS